MFSAVKPAFCVMPPCAEPAPRQAITSAEALGVIEPCVCDVVELLPALLDASVPPVVAMPEKAMTVMSRGEVPLIVSDTVGLPAAEFLK